MRFAAPFRYCPPFTNSASGTAGLHPYRDPPQHGAKLHSTNALERLNGEIKRRTEVVGIFPNEAAITPLVGAILLKQNDQSAVQRSRYMTLESIRNSVMIPSSACHNSPADAPGSAPALCQLHHSMGHDRIAG